MKKLSNLERNTLVFSVIFIPVIFTYFLGYLISPPVLHGMGLLGMFLSYLIGIVALFFVLFVAVVIKINVKKK